MSTRLPPPCTHEMRPGTTVCLHCRHDALVAARARWQRFAVRGGIGAASLGILAIGGMLVLPLLRGRQPDAEAAVRPDRTPAGREAAAAHTPVPAPLALASMPAGSPAAAPMESAGAVPPAVATTSAAPTSAAPTVLSPAAATVSAKPPARALPHPVVAPGRTALADGMSAERVGDTVIVSFDTELARTRRPMKFEGIVRATLPAVYGAVADSALAAMPAGGIAGAGDLLTDLPTRGVRLRAPGGTSFLVTPATRPGRDGPLVVRYRAVAQR